MEWSKKETDLMNNYWTTNISELTLYKKLHKLNPARTFKSIARRLEDMKASGRKKDVTKALSDLKIGYLDIEATNLNADFGYIVSWVIKEKDKPKIYRDVIKKKDIMEYKFDYNVVKSLLKTMATFDIIYTHYGNDFRFDVPFIRSRAYKNNLEHLIPPKNSVYLRDTYPIAKKKLKAHSNRLGSIGELLNIKVQKTPLSSHHWTRGALGDPRALAYILDHNIKDVLLLEAVHKKLSLVENETFNSI